MPHPVRALLAAALGCVLVMAVPGDAGATPPPGAGSGDSHGFSRAEARQVLHHASNLLRTGASDTARPARADLTMALRDLHLARPALTGADRRTADRLLSRSTPAAKAQVDADGLSLTCSVHFCVHFGGTSTLSWARTTLGALEHVWNVEVPLMGRRPLSDGGSAAPEDNNPDDRLDVFLEDLGRDGYYGYCTTDDDTGGSQVAAYCALDDDFARHQYGAAPLSSLRVTAAHEFFHTIQFAADVTEPVWFLEGSATWVEDVVYDDINDNYQYLDESPIRFPRLSLDYAGSNFPYGAFIFFSYSAQRRGLAVVRQFWDHAVGAPRALAAIHTVIGAGSWPGFFTTFGSWNTLPLHSYSERGGYPTPTWWGRKTLAAGAATTGARAVRLPHLASAALLLTPGPRLPVRKHLMVTVDGPPKATGSAALLQRRFKNGRVTHTMITLGVNGNGHLLVPFNRRVLKSVAVVLANTGGTGAARLFTVRAGLR